MFPQTSQNLIKKWEGEVKMLHYSSSDYFTFSHLLSMNVLIINYPYIINEVIFLNITQMNLLSLIIMLLLYIFLNPLKHLENYYEFI